MTTAALIVAVLALVVSIISVVYTRRAAQANEDQARAARNQDLRERAPQLQVTLDKKISAEESFAAYVIRNDGPQDLDSVVVHRPEGGESVSYPVAAPGRDFDSTAEVGPLPMGQSREFVLACGPVEFLPEMRVRIVTRSGGDTWAGAYLLEDPKFHVMVF